jgi:Thylakoid formation protein
VGKKVKTVGEAFAEFSEALGFTVNALYKNMVTDIVGSTHLIVVNARFSRDPVWSLGILTSLELLLKNYPEKEVADKLKSALFQALGMNEAEILSEAKMLSDWAKGKTMAEVEAALTGEGTGPIAEVAKKIKGDEFWMYSRYFGIGLLKVMELAGMEMDKDEVYPVMEKWMSEKLGRSHLTACVSLLVESGSACGCFCRFICGWWVCNSSIPLNLVSTPSFAEFHRRIVICISRSVTSWT